MIKDFSTWLEELSDDEVRCGAFFTDFEEMNDAQLKNIFKWMKATFEDARKITLAGEKKVEEVPLEKHVSIKTHSLMRTNLKSVGSRNLRMLRKV